MVTIRLATPADIPLVNALRTEMLNELRAHRGSSEGADNLEASNAEYLARAIPSGQYAGWIAEEGGAPVAISGCFYFERPPMERPGAVLEARIVNVYTRREWRGRGIGSALTRAAIEHARARGARRVRLGAAPDGRGVYARLGFQPVTTEMELKLLPAQAETPEGGATTSPAPAGGPEAASSPGRE